MVDGLSVIILQIWVYMQKQWLYEILHSNDGFTVVLCILFRYFISVM